MPDGWKNKLYFGDNLDVLRQHIATESIDLIYLDPPFNSKKDYNLIFADEKGTPPDSYSLGGIVEELERAGARRRVFPYTGCGLNACNQSAQLLWLERHAPEVLKRAATAFQAAFFERLNASPPHDAGLAAALYMAQRVRERPREARLLLLHRREDFVDRGWPPALRRRAERLGRQVELELRDFSRRLCGSDAARTVRMVAYAVLEAPFAAIRRHVAANESPPPHVDALIRVTFEAVMGLLGGGDIPLVEIEINRFLTRRGALGLSGA